MVYVFLFLKKRKFEQILEGYKIMKIGLQTWGSDGDIRPFLALAGGLSSAGHDVTVAYTSVDNKDYSLLAKTMNIKLVKTYKKIDYNLEELKDMIEPKSNLKQKVLVLKTFFEPFVDEMFKASMKLSSENDLVIGHAMVHTLLTAAEKNSCRRAVVVLSPIITESKYIPPIGMPNLGKGINSLLWRYQDYLIGKKCYPSANKIRTEEGLLPIKSFQKEVYISKELTLIAMSPFLCTAKPDWGDNIQVCGFFDVPTDAEKVGIPDDLRAFLDAGDPQVYLTFGSLTQFNVEDTTRLLTEAVRLSGRRAIIQSDWDNVPGIADTPDIFKITKIPHHTVFPHCSVIVHHGGVGTSHTALRSGCPSVVVEHAGDQIYCGQQLPRIGVAGKMLHIRSITAKKLANGINAVLNSPSMKKEAEKIGETMLKEDGVNRAVELIENRFC